jgi:excisionase family DNA binding protein
VNAATSASLPALISIPEAAALLGLSRASAYRYAAAGELPTGKFGRRVYVVTNRIRDLLDNPESLTAESEGAA